MVKRKQTLTKEKAMEDTEPVLDLTELESPTDPKIRRGFEIKLKEYQARLRGNGESWQNVNDFKKKHREFEDFRYVRYKLLLVQALLRQRPGGKVAISDEFLALERNLRINDETVDEPVFVNCCKAMHDYLTGNLELPTDEPVRDIPAQPS
jgi:hypothetical protein